MLKPIIAAYEELAVGIAEEFSLTHSLESTIREFEEDVDKLYKNKEIIGETEGALMMNRFESMYLKLKNALEEIAVNLRRIQSSNNTQKYNMLREVANQAMFVRSNREDQNVHVDESGINLDPSATGVHFVEYTFDRKKCEITGSHIIENPGEYGLMTIIDNWAPNITAYVDSVYQILNIVYSERMQKLQGTLNYVEGIMEELNGVHYKDAIGKMQKILFTYGDYCSSVNKNNMYQFIQNSVKNFDIVNKAINYYLNSDNLEYGF